jgi:hypothetical protein
VSGVSTQSARAWKPVCRQLREAISDLPFGAPATPGCCLFDCPQISCDKHNTFQKIFGTTRFWHFLQAQKY